jgi:hypothetical protein
MILLKYDSIFCQITYADNFLAELSQQFLSGAGSFVDLLLGSYEYMAYTLHISSL